jgi:maleylacetate reductase
MALRFTYAGSPAQIVFGAGSRARLAEWIDRLGCRRALLLSTPGQAGKAEALAATLDGRAAGIFARATMHTPVDVTEAAVAAAADVRADCLVALGGGSTTGLGKAIAYRTDLPQIVIPTTYAGSEATSILGQTAHGVKETARPKSAGSGDLRSRAHPGLPVAVSVASGSTLWSALPKRSMRGPTWSPA